VPCKGGVVPASALQPESHFPLAGDKPVSAFHISSAHKFLLLPIPMILNIFIDFYQSGTEVVINRLFLVCINR
jgi:hypothetical protein